MSYVLTFAPGAATGLTPTIRIRKVSDGSLVVTDDSMAEVGDGAYRYDFASVVVGTQYVFRIDFGVSYGLDRYAYGEYFLAWDEVSESGQTYGKQFRDMRATLLGKTTGGGTTAEAFLAADGVTTRVSQTNDGANRLTITVPGT
jgi:hypothetical protein